MHRTLIRTRTRALTCTPARARTRSLARLALVAGSLVTLSLVAACGGSSTSAAPPSVTGASSAGPGPSSSAPSGPSGPNPNATESNPPGDIPDNQVYVPYSLPGASFSVTVPEGWARTTVGGAVVFSDKLNSIRMESVAAASAPTVATVQQQDVATLRTTVPQIAAVKVSAVTRKHATGVRLTYLADSEPNPVTSKVVRDAVERYEFWHAGTTVVLTLTGPKNADNVDPWRIVTDSLVWK